MKTGQAGATNGGTLKYDGWNGGGRCAHRSEEKVCGSFFYIFNSSKKDDDSKTTDLTRLAQVEESKARKKQVKKSLGNNGMGGKGDCGKVRGNKVMGAPDSWFSPPPLIIPLNGSL